MDVLSREGHPRPVERQDIPRIQLPVSEVLKDLVAESHSVVYGLYKIDEHKDYGSLNPLVAGADHTIKMDYVVDNWERMPQFYASFKAGHVTASTALKRITGFTTKNHFYQANLQLGPILKTEHILYWMADPQKRKRTRKGLLKVEQIHQLARDITYGNRGRPKETRWMRSPVPAIARH